MSSMEREGGSVPAVVGRGSRESMVSRMDGECIIALDFLMISVISACRVNRGVEKGLRSDAST